MCIKIRQSAAFYGPKCISFRPSNRPSMKVSAILKGKPDQFNRLPVVIRIAEGKKRTYHVTPFRATKTDFDKGLDEATSARIRQLAIRYESAALEGKRKYRDQEFFQYVDECLKKWNHIRKHNTIRNYKAERNKLKEFRSSFKLSQVTPDFLEQYSSFLYAKKQNISTTVWTSFKFIRKIILQALRERLIQDNPFNVFKIEPYQDPQKEYLTKEEINKIEKYLPKAGPHFFCATWFLIGCYTGWRYSDMNAFRKKQNLRSDRLILYTIKTNDIVSMPLSKRLKKLLESINYQSMFISNQKFNDSLKTIAKAVELPPISVHTCRHSFAVMCADNGISQEVTARLLGHKSLRSTAVYYKITNPRIDREIRKLG